VTDSVGCSDLCLSGLWLNVWAVAVHVRVAGDCQCECGDSCLSGLWLNVWAVAVHV
jgi:hypothetical protein